ncbi:MAG TPA: metallophosphoesterase family protein [Bacteroidales bacterium]|nr:metallophosphoesterase family protein [Bacteroidales bacterium]HPS16349.1 metallophosphoesterase family protein [Bacteroidales bacterium]
MKRIGLLSDTHSYFHKSLADFFKDVDEIWHAGDFGSIEIANELRKLKPLRGVYGNIDGQDIRKEFPKHQRFYCEEVKVWMTHIGGYPGKYDISIKQEILLNPPKLFISGHSHILKVMNDKNLKLLHINPGAAGKYGMHHMITAVRFVIDKTDIKNLEVLEIARG